MKTVLFGLFPSRDVVDAAIRDLNGVGIPPETVSVVQQSQDAEKMVTRDKAPVVKKTAVQGAEMGAAGGATAGVIGSIVLGATGPLGFLPGLIAAAATGVTGSIVGGITGGLVGALVGVGFPEGAAKSYESGIQQGKLLVGTEISGQTEEKVRNIYSAYNAQEMQVLEIADEETPQPV